MQNAQCVGYLENSLTLNRQVLRGHSHRPALHHTGYDVITDNVIVKKTSKIPPPTAAGGMSPEWLSEDHEILSFYLGQLSPQTC